MTRVRYEHGTDPPEYRMTIEGHAGAGPKGEDIVCAAASILMWTLAERAAERPELGSMIHTDSEGARAEIRCRPEKGWGLRCRDLYETILTGYELLREEYPDFVEVELT